MDHEKYETTLKKVRATKPTENFMVVNLSLDYAEKLVLPQSAALALLHAIGQAEILTNRYNHPPTILPVREESMTSQLLSRDDYELYKVAALMGIATKDLKEALQNKTKEPTP